jgi:ribosome-associated protein
MEKIKITTEYIKLEAVLKLAGIAGTGGEAKQMIQNGEVLVDGKVCVMRGKKIRPDNVVSASGRELAVTYSV